MPSITTRPTLSSEIGSIATPIKSEFTDQWLDAGLPEAKVSESQRRRGERGIWQPRFWEHTVRDEKDLERSADYIHWNPRKHKLVV